MRSARISAPREVSWSTPQVALRTRSVETGREPWFPRAFPQSCALAWILESLPCSCGGRRLHHRIAGKGAPTMRNRRCSCITTSQRTIQSKFLKDLKQFAPSSYCEKTEIIATMKNGDQTCLNPDSTDVKELIQEWAKQVSQKKKQKKGKRYQKSKKVLKVKKYQHPHQKKTT
ncbi:C-X-C motif chemokine 9 isoform X1 [Mirounga leonina]|uniref:C-X-C motif chemokine 9 isoform X1 n=1 Tax=Mirounga leonina TaxID=9715 RepID=UPI00156C3FB6|nr:C-X-C motif chemokine 9 isoform X1 [Mirounga leonina]